MAITETTVPNADLALTMYSTGPNGWSVVDELIANVNTSDFIYCGGADKYAMFLFAPFSSGEFDKITDVRIEITCDQIKYTDRAALRVICYCGGQLIISGVYAVPKTDTQPKVPLTTIYFDISGLNIPDDFKDDFMLYVESEFVDSGTIDPLQHH